MQPRLDTLPDKMYTLQWTVNLFLINASAKCINNKYKLAGAYANRPLEDGPGKANKMDKIQIPTPGLNHKQSPECICFNLH